MAHNASTNANKIVFLYYNNREAHMILESRKLHVIEEVLRLNNEALLAKIEALLKRAYTKPKQQQVRLSEKYAGSLKLTDKQYTDMQQQLTDMRNEWE